MLLVVTFSIDNCARTHLCLIENSGIPLWVANVSYRVTSLVRAFISVAEVFLPQPVFRLFLICLRGLVISLSFYRDDSALAVIAFIYIHAQILNRSK